MRPRAGTKGTRVKEIPVALRARAIQGTVVGYLVQQGTREMDKAMLETRVVIGGIVGILVAILAVGTRVGLVEEPLVLLAVLGVLAVLLLPTVARRGATLGRRQVR